MATRMVWTPEGGYAFPASNFPEVGIDATTGHMVWAFDAATDETVYLPGVAPQGLTGTLTIEVFYRMASANTGSVRAECTVEAITPGDALDTDASTSFAASNSGGEAVPGTAGYVESFTITLTNADSIAAGDMFRLAFSRDANGDTGTDDATGDLQVLRIELRDGA
jgi:hypothetical protein